MWVRGMGRGLMLLIKMAGYWGGYGNAIRELMSTKKGCLFNGLRREVVVKISLLHTSCPLLYACLAPTAMKDTCVCSYQYVQEKYENAKGRKKN